MYNLKKMKERKIYWLRDISTELVRFVVTMTDKSCWIDIYIRKKVIVLIKHNLS